MKAEAPTITSARVAPFINTKTFTEQFGVQVLLEGEWLRLETWPEPAVFDTAEAANDMVTEILRQIALAPGGR